MTILWFAFIVEEWEGESIVGEYGSQSARI